jgi:hypothetical protein
VRLSGCSASLAVVFGGDADNFNFPRFALDAAFLRLYEDGHPASTPAFLQWTVYNQPQLVAELTGSGSAPAPRSNRRSEREAGPRR